MYGHIREGYKRTVGTMEKNRVGLRDLERKTAGGQGLTLDFSTIEEEDVHEKNYKKP